MGVDVHVAGGRRERRARLVTHPADERDAFAATRRAVEAVWRIESARVIAHAARIVRDVGVAEEIAQDAFVAALESWPDGGIPENPGAWLMTAAKHRALDRLRRAASHARAHEAMGADLEALEAHFAPDFVEALDTAREDEIGDDLLRLVFVACHPVLPKEGRVALTLRLLGGLTTAEIARAFLVPEATVAQRIVRAKRTLAGANVPFEVPRLADLKPRLASVFEVIYLIFNEGYTATAGQDWTRPALCEEALRLGRMLAELVPAEGEAHGLVALMELQASRLPARVNAAGHAVLLADQDRSRWDALLIRRGVAALSRGAACAGAPGPYALQAALAACHARAPSVAATDWAQIVAIYDALLALDASPVVRLNRAVAVGMAQGPHAALELVDALCEEAALRDYPWLPAARGDLLEKLARHAEARAEFERAASLTQNARDREVLLGRAQACAARA
ncbi:RNA polymerase sigma factor [Paraburkholderia mimosarum]|uniref:RNA polymerase sigma factor n=1 Tax=Paraburkholderia mimosarum TaxID=312026 RepID=UPI0038995B10